MKTSVILALVVALSASWAQSPVTRSDVTPGGRHSLADREGEMDRAELDRALSAKAVMTGATQGSGSVEVTVEVRNISGRTITAHEGNLVARYADGHEELRRWAIDVLGNTIMSQIPGITVKDARTFRNGETFSQKLLLPQRADAAPVSLTAWPTMAVFDDKTTLGSALLVKIVVEGRKRYAGELLDVDHRLEAVLSNPAVAEAVKAGRDPMPAVRAGLSEQIANTKSLPDAQRGSAEVMLRSYQAISVDGMSLDPLKTFLAANQTVQRAMEEHAKLVAAKQ